jgi:hypothetical protein
MHRDAETTRRAVFDRDGARVRVRRFTGGAVFASVAVVGAIASYVAHGKTQTIAVPDTPPAPSILAPGESPPQVSQPSQPVSPPVAVQAPPVVVSGGS